MQTSSRSIWNPCLWLATKEFWQISSISFPGLMQDRQLVKEVCRPIRQRRKFAKYSCHRKELGLSTTITNCKWRKNWLRQLFQLKILRTGSLLCSWTMASAVLNCISTTSKRSLSLEKVSCASPTEIKVSFCWFSYDVIKIQNQRIFDPSEFLPSWNVREAKNVLWYSAVEFLSFCVTRHLRAIRESCHVG